MLQHIIQKIFHEKKANWELKEAMLSWKNFQKIGTKNIHIKLQNTKEKE